MTAEVAAHGRLVAKGRVDVPSRDLPAIEARIPDGLVIQVQEVPGWLLLYPLDPETRGRLSRAPLRVSGGTHIDKAVAFALSQWREVGVIE